MAKKRKLNKNVVIGLTLALFASMVILSVIMLNQLQRRDPAFFVELAEEAKQREDWEQAAVFYQKAWMLGQRSTYLVDLGQMLLNLGDVQRARQSWAQAMVNEPGLVSAHRANLELNLELARLRPRAPAWVPVRQAAEAMISIVPESQPEELAFAHDSLGIALSHLIEQDEQNAERATEELATAARLAPDNVDYQLEVAMDHFRNDRKDAGTAIIDRLAERYDQSGAESSKIARVQGRYFAAQREWENAERYFHRAIELASNAPEELSDAQLALAVYLTQKWVREKRGGADNADAYFDEAVEVLEAMMTANPDDYDAYLQLALLKKSAADPAGVLEVCERRLQRGLTRVGVEATRAKLHTFQLMIFASEACLAQAMSPSDEAEEMDRDEWLDRAEKYVADATGELPNHPRSLSQAGRILVARGQYRAALVKLREADQAYRTADAVDWENEVLMAQVHLQLKQAGAAKASLEEVRGMAARVRPTDPAFWTVYAQALFETEEYDRALAIADRILLAHPDNRAAAQLKAAVYEREGRQADAGRVFEAATGDAGLAAILTAREHALEGRPEAAVSTLRAALGDDPDDVRVITALAHELMNQGRAEDADELVSEAVRQHPDVAELKRLAVSVQPDLSDEERDEAVLAVINDQEDEYKRLLDLVSYYLGQKDAAMTLEMINQAEERLIERDTPLARDATLAQHRSLLRAKIRLAAQLGDHESLDAARDAAAKYNVDGAGGKTILGLYHMAHKDYELAATAFRQVVAEQPTDSWSLAHLGQCLASLRRPDDARDAFDRALLANPNEAIAHRGLAAIAMAQDEPLETDRHLEACERLIPNDPWVRKALLVRAERDDPAAALQRREALLASAPDDAENLRRLVALADAVGNPNKADRYVEHLLDLDAANRETVVVASEYFRRSGRAGRALELIQQFASRQSNPEDRARAQILIADHLSAVGDIQEAERILLAAVDTADTLELEQRVAGFYLNTARKPRKARIWFDRAVNTARSKHPGQVATLLAQRIACLLDRGINDLEAARTDVRELRANHPDDPRSVFWESEVYARAGRVEDAIAALTEFLTLRPDSAYSRYQRARHYIAIGETAAAVEDLDTIKRNDPTALQLAPRLLLASLYYQSGQIDEGLRELESLVADAPGSPRAVEELVNGYLRADRPVDADRVITAELNRQGDQPSQRWLFLRARISLELNDHRKALDDFKRAAALSHYSPESMSAVLDVFIETGQLQDGVTYYRAYAGSNAGHPLTQSKYGLMLLRLGQIEPAVVEFRQAMTRALADSPNTVRQVSADLRRSFPDDSDLAPIVAAFEHDAPAGVAGRANDRLLTRLYRLAERTDETVALLERLIATATDDTDRAALLQEKAEIHDSQGDARKAQQAYEESLKYDPDNWITLNNLAYILSDKLGDGSRGLVYARRAAGLTETAQVLDTLGWIYDGLGRYPSAIAELSRAVRLEPGDALLQYHLGEAYRHSGEFSQAAAVQRAARKIARSTKQHDLVTQIEASLNRIEARDSAAE